MINNNDQSQEEFMRPIGLKIKKKYTNLSLEMQVDKIVSQ